MVCFISDLADVSGLFGSDLADVRFIFVSDLVDVSDLAGVSDCIYQRLANVSGYICQ
jgi:hypothetical protein